MIIYPFSFTTFSPLRSNSASVLFSAKKPAVVIINGVRYVLNDEEARQKAGYSIEDWYKPIDPSKRTEVEKE